MYVPKMSVVFFFAPIRIGVPVNPIRAQFGSAAIRFMCSVEAVRPVRLVDQHDDRLVGVQLAERGRLPGVGQLVVAVTLRLPAPPRPAASGSSRTPRRGRGGSAWPWPG